MILRYVRAFWKALRLTLRGETISDSPVHQPRLREWMRESVRAVDGVRAAQDRAGTTLEQRKEIMLHIDKRDLRMETALQTIRHHLTVEYPYLLKQYTRFSVMTIQASNLNDQYLATRFAELETLPSSVRDALVALRDHLAAIPPPDPEPETDAA